MDVVVSQICQCLLSCGQQEAWIKRQLEALKLLKQIVFGRFRKLALCDRDFEPVIMGPQRRHETRFEWYWNSSVKYTMLQEEHISLLVIDAWYRNVKDDDYGSYIRFKSQSLSSR